MKDNIGLPSDRGLRQTPKNWGKRKKIAVIKPGEGYKRLEDWESKTDFKEIKTVRINKIGGVE